MLFILGLGLVIGQIHTGVLYGLMILLLLLEQLPFMSGLDLFGSNFYTSYPATLTWGTSGEPAFVLPAYFLSGRLLLTIIGIVLVSIGTLLYTRKKTGEV